MKSEGRRGTPAPDFRLEMGGWVGLPGAGTSHISRASGRRDFTRFTGLRAQLHTFHGPSGAGTSHISRASGRRDFTRFTGLRAQGLHTFHVPPGAGTSHISRASGRRDFTRFTCLRAQGLHTFHGPPGAGTSHISRASGRRDFAHFTGLRAGISRLYPKQANGRGSSSGPCSLTSTKVRQALNHRVPSPETPLQGPSLARDPLRGPFAQAKMDFGKSHSELIQNLKGVQRTVSDQN